jgi:hypothetical protein
VLSRATVGILMVLGAIVVIGVGCTDDKPSAGARVPLTAKPSPATATVVTNEDGFVRPTAVAKAKAEALASVTKGYEDCGRVYADAGWPTTVTFPGTHEGTCLAAAYQARQRAVATFTGRDQQSGALVTRFRTDGSPRVKITRSVVSARGKVTTAATTCRPVTTAGWGLDLGGHLTNGLDFNGPVPCP